MLQNTVQQIEDATVLCCRGRLIIGEAYATLREAAMSQGHVSLLVLDLAQVDCIDAGGLGVLLGVRKWAQDNGISFKLMNVTNRIEQILELTALDRVFEFCPTHSPLHPMGLLSRDGTSFRMPDNRELAGEWL